MLRPRPLPSGFIPPCIPALSPEPLSGDGWLHEIKHDGHRTLVAIGDSRARAFTRTGLDWSTRYPRVVVTAAALPCRSALIDGEAIIQDAAGVSDFSGLARAMAFEPERIVLFAFDLLMLDGEDLRTRPLSERRARLEELLADVDRYAAIQFSAAVAGDGRPVFAEAQRLGLEGIVSKRASSKYRSGTCTAWRKTKCVTEGDFVVLGIERPAGKPAMALLARQAEGGLDYAGAAFVGLAALERETFWRRAEDLAIPAPALAGVRRKGATWCRPEQKVRVRYLRGGSELIRHAAIARLAE
jgi:DNA ligase D-like protein (predicted ligase)